jgi:hypothetical protein
MIVTAMLSAAAVFLLSVMVAADDIRIKDEFSGQQLLHRFICGAGDASVNRDPSLLHGGLGSSSDPAADQCVDIAVFQKTGQGTMSFAVCPDYLRRRHRAILNVVKFELFRPSEMLKNISIAVGYRDPHDLSSFF